MGGGGCWLSDLAGCQVHMSVTLTDHLLYTLALAQGFANILAKWHLVSWMLCFLSIHRLPDDMGGQQIGQLWSLPL